MKEHSINQTRFDFIIRNALKNLNEAKNLSKNDALLLCYIKDIKDIITKTESLVNKKEKFNINLETKNVCECENNCVYFTGVYDTGGNPVCIEDIVDTKTTSKHKFGVKK